MAARFQMSLSLGFHIIFASVGMVMPFLMAVAHWIYLVRKKKEAQLLTLAWSKGLAIFIVVGAVSGTALSFELGLLWPRFMLHAGPIIGMPFSLEGAAFFLEAIALGIFLYGWKRVRPWVHWASGVTMGITGVISAFFVICANAWMNSPAGFDWNQGQPIQIDPWAAMFNDAIWSESIHMVVAAFEAVGFAVSGIHAFLFLRTRYPIHWTAFRIAFVFAALAAMVQPLVGDFSAKSVARRQPIKLAAMEGLFETTQRAPLILGGIPNVALEKTEYAIAVPGFLSFLAFRNWNATVQGLKDFPREHWPPVVVTHVAFQVMILIGFFLTLVGSVGLLIIFYRRSPEMLKNKILYLCIFCTPLGFIALESGWIVTEVGRQPWIIYGLLKTSESLTPRPGVIYHFVLYGVLYSLLSVAVGILMIRQIIDLHQKLKQMHAER